MSEIYVFSSKDENNDYASFGLVGALIPTEATFNEVANGDSTIEISHPIDDFGRYKALVNGNIIVAPVPVRTTPEIQNGKVVTTVWTYKVKPEDQLTSSKQRTLYRKAKGSTRMRVLKAGEEMTVVSRPEDTDARWKVKTKYGTGYMLQSGIELVEEKKIEDNSGSIEEVQSPWTVTPQLFRIYEVKKSLDEVSVSARHISYDLLYNVTTYSSDDEADTQTAVEGVLNNCVNAHEFNAYTNVENVNSGLHYNGKNPIDAFFDEEEGICKKFDVSVIRDNFDLYFLHDPGINRGIRILYGKNLTGVDFIYSIDEVATRIFPVGEKKDGTPFYLSDNLEERYVDSSKIDDYPVVHVHKLDCENCKIGDKDSDGSKITEKIARARMRKQAEDLLKNGCDEPKIEMDVEFVNLGDTEEYKQFKNLENAFLYDYILVEVPKLDINVTARITEIEWDIIAERMNSVKIGSVGKTLANTGITSWQIPSGINGSKIGAGTVGSRELGNKVIDTRHMQAESISTDILQVNCVTAKQIAANSITADKIDANAVTAEKIDAKAITAEKIDAGAVTAEKIEAGAITADKIGANAITAEKIEAGVITGEKINAESVGAALAEITKAQIAEAEIDGAKIKNATIDSAKIALGAITTALIQNGAIGEAQIADASITSGKIVSLNADVIDAGTLSVERLLIKGKDGLFYALNATVDGITAEELSKEEYENQLSGQVIIAKSITADQIAAHTITANELAANTITAGQINVADLFANQATINEINNRILNAETINALNGRLDLSANESIQLLIGGKLDSDGNAAGLDTGESGVSVRITKDDFDVDVPGDKGDLHLGMEGGTMGVLVINESITAPNIAYTYSGSGELYVNSEATSAQMETGNYYRGLGDALVALNRRMIYKDVVINMQTDFSGDVVLEGISGTGTITIHGGGHTLTGSMTIRSVSGIKITIDNLELVHDGYNEYTLMTDISDIVKLTDCTINGNDTADGTINVVYMGDGTRMALYGCALYNAHTLVSAVAHQAQIFFSSIKGGNCNTFISADCGAMVSGKGTRPDGAIALDDCVFVRPDSLSSLTIDYGSAQPIVPPITSATYTAIATDTYSPGYQNWRYGSHDDPVQGFVTNYGRLRACIWFDNTAIRTDISGKTVSQASLKLSMLSGYGRDAAVSVQLYGTTMEYSNHTNGAPNITKEYGTIAATINPGETLEITLPTQVATDLVNGTINALMLISDDTEKYKTNAWSRNYARFAGTTTGNNSLMPALFMQFQ